MSKKQEQKNWFGIVLSEKEVYLCDSMKKNERKKTKLIKGFLAHIEEKGVSDDMFEEEIFIGIPNFRIPRTMEHLEKELEFYKFLKANKICGDSLTQRTNKAKQLELVRKNSAKNKGTKLKLAQ